MNVESSLSRSLRLIPPGTSYALLIRHAERHNIDMKSDFGNGISITNQGVMDSRKFGRCSLARTINGIYSSPVLRCIQTAKEIMTAADLCNLSIITKNTLGEPGSFISDPSIAGKHFLETSTNQVVRKYINTGKLEGFLPISEGSKLLLSEILLGFSSHQSYNLYVSHDAVIMPFISYYTGEKFSDCWLGFLDGVIITQQDGNVKMLWDGEEHSIEGAIR